MVQTTQRRREAAGRASSFDRNGRSRNDGLTDELREDLRAMIARRAPALRELERH